MYLIVTGSMGVVVHVQDWMMKKKTKMSVYALLKTTYLSVCTLLLCFVDRLLETL